MNDGFFKVAAATPSIKVADCGYNENAVLELMREAEKRGVGAVVFPELCLTGYTCGDLFRDRTLITAAQQTLTDLLKQSRGLNLVAVVGLPVAIGADLYNAAAVICRGKLLGLATKSSIPNYSEFYEARHFTSGPEYVEVSFCGQTVPLGSDLIFKCESMPELVIGVEICEDLWIPCPPSSRLAQCGATLLLNPSASDEVIGKAPYRRSLVQGQSARLIAAYAYADAGEGESSTDLVYSGHNVIAENGTVLAESTHFTTGLTTADVDLQRMQQERLRTTTWSNAGEAYEVSFTMDLPKLNLERKFPALPFVPDDTKDLKERCEMILNLQANGLKTRLKHTGSKCVILGISGGLDSTLALMVCVKTADKLGFDRKRIIGITMPGFGTTDRTYNNAVNLMKSLGITQLEISIKEASIQHFKDINHNPKLHNVVYENTQARERTQILMDIANQRNGIVIGTGDLSELALGWATYNGDHMSMYAVNSGVPKTLVRYLVDWSAHQVEKSSEEILRDVCNTPVSPELLPADENGDIAQKTEDLVGPYELHDFFLYYFVRFGFSPEKILFLAKNAFKEIYPDETIQKWLRVFLKRFFAQQFKRSCMPDGPKVGSINLSPRGDWRMPSDAIAFTIED